jgi:hypothetical protein
VAPTDQQSKRDYFDSLYHAEAVVGINTTALVDSAIVRRPVFTLMHDRFRSTQTGTPHFSYLLARDEDNGLLSVAHTWEEHFDQLGAIVRSPNGHVDQIDSFLRAFIRPHGLDQPAAPLMVEAIERTARMHKDPPPSQGRAPAIVGAVAGILGTWHALLHRLSPRTLLKAEQRFVKRRRKRAKERQSFGRRTDAAEVAAVKADPAEKERSRAAKEQQRAVKDAARVAKEEQRAAKTAR